MSKKTGTGATGVTTGKNNKKRQFNRIVFKRKRVIWDGIIKEKVFKIPSSQDLYGHWWVEINNESYGWWPEHPVTLPETIKGVGGFLNGFKNPTNVPNSKDLDHGKMADEEFVMIVAKDDTRTQDDVINIIRAFAKSFSAGWSYPARPPRYENCHTFQIKMIKECDFYCSGRMTITNINTGEVILSTDTPKNVDEVN